MLPLTPHDQCHGTGHDPNTSLMTGCNAQGGLTERLREEPDDTRPLGPIEKCGHCGGWGIRGRNGAYRTATAVKGARTRGTAQTCLCGGTGRWRSVPVVRDCYGCNGTGNVPMWDADVDPVVPQELLSTTAATQFMIDWLHSATVYVLRQDRAATWGEYHLGADGAMFTVTDYGRTWELTNKQIADKVAQQLLERTSRPSFSKLADKDTHRVGTTLLILVTRGGYSPMVADANVSLPQLPPTYTPDVLNRPWA